MNSLRTQLTLFWILLLAACGALAVTMTVLYQSSVGAQVDVSRSATESACATIAARHAKSVQADAAAAERLDLLQVLLHLVLMETPQMEGGVWRVGEGNLAYAYPTYEGSGEKRDVPAAEQPLIAELATQAARTSQARTDVVRGSREAIVITACPLIAGGTDLAAWTMTRASGSTLAAQGSLRSGLGALLVLVLGSAVWLGWLMARGLRHVGALQNSLASGEDVPAWDAPGVLGAPGASGAPGATAAPTTPEELAAQGAHGAPGAPGAPASSREPRIAGEGRGADAAHATMPLLGRTGVQELDRIVDAFNRFRERFNAAQARIREAELQRGRDLRLATLGRMTGAIAHEIRNPIAAMRLKAENALAGPPARHPEALRSIVAQVDRLDGLVKSLLGLVQPITISWQPQALHPWLSQRLNAVSCQGPEAPSLHLELALTPTRATLGAPSTSSTHVEPVASFDPLHLARAVDNLLDNAVRHAAPGGQVTLRAIRDEAGALVLQVDDDGAGVPEALRATLFEPFASGRADGTGLGLALAREVAFAHGGDLRHVALARGTRFELEIPWRAS